jgi:hypothetical protein
MPDGQLKSHRLSVYVTAPIADTHKPRLRLFRGHSFTERGASEEDPIEPAFIASGQQWTEVIDGRAVGQSGTILLFDASNLDFGFKAMIRVRPAITWTDGATQRTVLGPREVNIGDIVRAIVWTTLIVGTALGLVLVLAWRRYSSPALLLTGVDGHLSLAQAQVACWTVFVGSIVLGYGLIRLEIPSIPESLLVLMGASLATGGLAFFQDARNDRTGAGAGLKMMRRAWAWGDLVRVFRTDGEPELSLAKAQMIFWTVLLLVLFVSKSILDGAIWAVPWPLVALMGFSQAGYLVSKTNPAPPSPAPPAPAPPQPPLHV